MAVPPSSRNSAPLNDRCAEDLPSKDTEQWALTTQCATTTAFSHAPKSPVVRLGPYHTRYLHGDCSAGDTGRHLCFYRSSVSYRGWGYFTFSELHSKGGTSEQVVTARMDELLSASCKY